jgi:hypothetical protein
VIAKQRLFRKYFNIGRHGTLPDHNTIKNWVKKFRTTASATNKHPEAESEPCEHRKTLKEYAPLSVVAPNDQHIDIQLLSTVDQPVRPICQAGFSLLGFLKSKVFQTRPADLHNLKQRIYDEINVIPPAMVFCVMESILNRVHQHQS